MVFEYLSSLGFGWGLPTWLTMIILAWTVVWKLLGLWKSARKKHVAWFIIMGILNTIGIIPILYIFIFSKLGKSKKTKKVLRKSPKKYSKKPSKKVAKKVSKKSSRKKK